MKGADPDAPNPQVVYTGDRQRSLCCGALDGHFEGERCPKDGRIVKKEAPLKLQHDRKEAELLQIRLADLRQRWGDEL